MEFWRVMHQIGIQYETVGNRRGSWHLTDIGTLAIHPLTIHKSFLGTVSEIFEYVKKHYDWLRFSPTVRIVTNHRVPHTTGCQRHGDNRARKSRTTLQNKVRLKVHPEQLTLFVNTSVTFKKMYHSIVFYYTVLIIAQKYTLFHIPVTKNIVKGLK